MNLEKLAKDLSKKFGDKIFNASDAFIRVNSSRMGIPVGVFTDALELAQRLFASRQNPEGQLNIEKVTKSLQDIKKILSE